MNKLLVTLTTVLISTVSFADSGTATPKVQCKEFAEKIMKSALGASASNFKLSEVQNYTIKKLNGIEDSEETIEKLIFVSEGASVEIETLPNYYNDNLCQLNSVVVKRN